MIKADYHTCFRSARRNSAPRRRLMYNLQRLTCMSSEFEGGNGSCGYPPRFVKLDRESETPRLELMSGSVKVKDASLPIIESLATDLPIGAL
mmetsp:Transcript_41030/g.99469  ORF Transcript_41030/g.99469 Transcript_41030/m.99469 type:complete len:92 (-) Transcript_41030:144-419(-)